MRIYRVRAIWRRAVTVLWYRWLFGAIGRGTVIFAPALFANTEFVRLGKSVMIRSGARLEVVLHGQDWRPSLEVGDRVNIEQNVHIVCHDRITIEDDVSITGHCAIVDVTHPHEAAFAGGKIGDAVDPGRSSVTIGRNSFVGFGSIILPNVRIGRNCMIGAGSVVASDIPDNAIAAGVPARVLRIVSISGERHG